MEWMASTRTHRCLATVLCLAFLISLGFAKEKKDAAQPMVLLWPDQNSPALRLTFGKFTQLATYNGQLSLESPVLIENISNKRIPEASLTVYMMDKGGVRVGNGMLSMSDLEPGQQVRVAFQVFSVGIPVRLRLVARNDSSGVPTSLKTVPLKVISVPPTASLKVDGRDVGITPITVPLGIGNHTLSFSKEGYATGSTPVDIKADEAPGGSITFELGGLAEDNVELRDGTVIKGDVISVSMTQVQVRIDGKDQNYDRNQVRKIILVQRDVVQPSSAPNATTSAPSKK